MSKIHDLIAFGNGTTMVVTIIRREGMDIFAVVKLDKDNNAEVIATYMEEKMALSRIDKELRKYNKEQLRLANLEREERAKEELEKAKQKYQEENRAIYSDEFELI